MFGGMPGMFGPIMMGSGGGGATNDFIMNQQRPIQDPFPPPLPMNALPGKVIKWSQKKLITIKKKID